MFNISLMTLLPLILLLSFETVFRGSLINSLLWFFQFPKQYLINYVLMYGLINIFYVLPRRIYLASTAMLISLFAVIGYISRQKLALRGEPLLPWDFILGKEALNITQQFSEITFDFPLISVLVLTLSLLLALRLIPREGYNWRTKIAPLLISLTILHPIVTESLPLEKTFDLRLINWSQKMNYDENGMLLGFLLNTRYLSVEKPENYKKETIKLILDQTKAEYSVDPNFKPNVIFVMSEAFWDPTLLEEVSFSEDPLPYFHSLQKSETKGMMLSPVYGGGTANTEFEVLTGFSSKFLPRGMVPYAQYVHKPLEALPTLFKRQGYEATAVHTYDNWFYRRNDVYREFGFDKFISKEFFDTPEYKGPYMRDTELSQRIVEEIKLTDKPDFVYAVSMQAHGPYPEEQNLENSITVDGNLSPGSKGILENYTQTIRDVDHSLKLLIEGLEELNEPSLVVFFGDHLPMLGTSYDVYKEADFFNAESSYEDYLNMYSVPFIVWDNFSTTQEDLRLSANFLGSYILERVKKEGSPLMDYLYTLNRKGSNMVVSEPHRDREQMTLQEIQRYRLLQYDALFGEEYAYGIKPNHRPKPNVDFVLGDGRTIIEKATPPNRSSIAIYGENFQLDHTVYVNGQPVKTNFDNQSHVIASLPWYFNNKSGKLEIQLKLLDSMGNIISESNTVELEIS